MGLYQAIQAIKDQQCFKIIVSVALTLVFVLLLIFFHQNKKKYVDLYAVCNSMSLNNRLQSLREMILIKHREIIDNDNKYRIKNAKFYYILSQSKTDENAYDLHCIQYRSSYVKHGLCENLQEIALCVFLLLRCQLAPQNFTSEIITESEMSVESYSTVIECAKKITQQGGKVVVEKKDTLVYMKL